MAARKEFKPGDIYAGNRKGNIRGLGTLGALITGSREVISAQLTGRQPDQKKVGSVGDVIIGARNIATFLNALCSGGSAEISLEQIPEPAQSTTSRTRQESCHRIAQQQSEVEI